MKLLQALDRAPKLNECTYRRIFREMLQALAAVHAAGIVHRDIKHDNFLCAGPRETVKLCDFGLSGTLDAGTVGLVGHNGTPPFMAPEMLRGGSYGGSVDIWGVGVIAYT